MNERSQINLSLKMLTDHFKKGNELVLDSTKITQDKATGDISWRRYTSGILSPSNYAEEYRHLLDGGQYSILLEDQSFIQFYYSFKGDKLHKARLAYYPSPYDFRLTDFDNEEVEDLLNSGISYQEIYEGIEMRFSTHLRIDYDGDVKSHAKAHMQFSAINALRIDLEYCILPAAFFDFIVENFYPEHHSDMSPCPKYCTMLGHARNNKIKQKSYRTNLYLTTK
ncbi:DUF2290 domain-containing protein [Pseudomonas aeruginosa]|uniref:DUF2290 domain-containing protein n=1 Tax=Pseudomonas aeruginosa TaxID=287 RepID=UPI0020237800|nr:DUF2290 domain-containing protein [Pseudomonas aeruginosa]MCO3335699.1 DUF2290 domain-containing protein [Pseudomonas aeruginosa]MCR3820124.1 DUF2290 domain-containing protein [Pseudomonas aeruginosa]MDY1359414.1 DUF2290 domain-containing protein [Pseudomonas aeruginosa]URH58903.1 DUF2290 domain-containing protein [Pseudomonas aeruginosa]HBO4443639.1 DUF2290 domain-containing protein [Pseudomonas aeruginosa]